MAETTHSIGAEQLREARLQLRNMISQVALDTEIPFQERIQILHAAEAAQIDQEDITKHFTKHLEVDNNWVAIRRRIGGMYVGKLDQQKPFEIARQHFKSRSLDVLARFPHAAIIGENLGRSSADHPVFYTPQPTEEFLELQVNAGVQNLTEDEYFLHRLRSAGSHIHVGIVAIKAAINHDPQFELADKPDAREIVQAELVIALLDLSQSKA